jgi:hypothetical protein
MLRIVTPELFRRGSHDTAGRKLLLRVEKALLREAKQLLRKRDFKAARKLLKRLVRLGGTLQRQAQILIQTATKEPPNSRPSKGTRVKSSSATRRLTKNGGGRRAPKRSRAKVSGQTAARKKAAKKAVTKIKGTKARPTPQAKPGGAGRRAGGGGSGGGGGAGGARGHMYMQNLGKTNG